MLTGGTDNDGTYGRPLTRVTSYNIYENAVVDLPDLQEARMQHGCTHYLNNDNQQVSKCVVGACWLLSIAGVLGVWRLLRKPGKKRQIS